MEMNAFALDEAHTCLIKVGRTQSMILTQTYLTSPSGGFKAYAYFLFNAYMDWRSQIIRDIREGLRILGRETGDKLSRVARA
jgi:hypothetical protein